MPLNGTGRALEQLTPPDCASKSFFRENVVLMTARAQRRMAWRGCHDPLRRTGAMGHLRPDGLLRGVLGDLTDDELRGVVRAGDAVRPGHSAPIPK